MAKTKQLPPRLQYQIRFLKGGRGKPLLVFDDEKAWALIGPDKKVVRHTIKKRHIVDWAAHELAKAWHTLRVRSELTIFTKSGSAIQDRRTYGADPRRTKG